MLIQTRIIFTTIILAAIVGLTACPMPTDLDITPPSEAIDFIATTGDSQVILSWVNPSDSDFDHVEISYGNPLANIMYDGIVESNGSIIGGLTNGIEYNFTIKAVDVLENISAGVTINATPVSSDNEPPAEVSELTTTVGNTQISLQWTNPLDADFKYVEIYYGTPFADTKFEGTINSNGTVITNLINDSEYSFLIKTVDTSGNISTGISKNATPDASAPSEVTNFVTTVENSGEITLSWIDPADADFNRVEIYYGESSADTKFAGTITATGTVISGFTSNDVEYSFLIKTIDDTDNISIGVSEIATPFYLDGTADIDMVSLTSGSFTMGDTLSASPAHTVTLTSDFALGKFEVTSAQWREVYEWAVRNGYTFSDPGMRGNGNDEVDNLADDTDTTEPVTSVDWGDVVVWCNAASEYEGLTPVYTNSGSVLKESFGAWNVAQCDWTVNGYRLPTEAEWEYAARGGQSDTNSGNYAGSTVCSDVAWDWNNSGSDTSPVGKLQPNELGLFDMLGNVSEWCWNNYAPYSSSAKIDPVGASSGSNWVSRGDSFTGYLPTNSTRGSYLPETATTSQGFRLAQSLNGGFIPDTTPPGPVTGYTAVAGEEQVTLSWTNPVDSDFSHTQILIVVDGSAPRSFEGTITPEGTVITELTNGDECTFVIWTYDTAGNQSGPPAVRKATPYDLTAPAEATGFTAIPSDAKVTLTWTNPGDADFSYVNITYGSPTADTVFSGVKNPSGTVINGLTNGIEYVFLIQTFDDWGNESTGIAINATPDGTPPAEVSGFSATKGDGEVTLSWTNPVDTDFNHVEILYGENSADTAFSGPLNPSGTVIGDLINGTEYTFAIKTVDTFENHSTGLERLVTPNYILDGSVYIQMKTVAHGIFIMGNETGLQDSEGISRAEVPTFSVEITTDFALGQYELTYAQWKEVYNWAINNGYTFSKPGQPGSPGSFPENTDDDPVTNIYWADIVVWCNAASEYETLTPVYSYSGSIIKDSSSPFNAPDCDWTANGYRLPTEAEWEYAARGGALATDTIYAGSNSLSTVGWYIGNSGGATHPVGQKLPNELGLYDMTGNVNEWCWNPNGEYSSSAKIDPIESPPSSNLIRMARGGSYNTLSTHSQVSYRTAISTPNEYYGFRVARSLNGGFTPDTTPPADITDFTVTGGSGKATLTWTNPPDSDFDHVVIFYKEVTSMEEDTLYEGSIDPSGTVIGIVTMFITEYSFSIVAYDHQGYENATVIVKAFVSP